MQGLLSAAKAPAVQTSLAKAALTSAQRAGTQVLRPQAPAFVKTGASAAQSARSVVASAIAEAQAPPAATPERDSQPGTPSSQVNGSAVVMKFILPASIVGPLLGKEGSHAQTIKKKTGVHIQFTKPGTAVYNQKDRMLIIAGDSPEKCKEAVKMMLDTVAADNAIERLKRTSPGNNNQNDKIYLRQVIPAICAGKVLGPGGETIGKICTKTGCAVIVEAKPENAAFVPFRLVNYMAKNVTELSDAVAEVLDQILMEPKYHNSIRDITSVCFRIVELPEKRAGSLLGPGGAHIKALQEVLRCKMGICESSSKPGSRFISIWGSPSNVKVAVDVVLVATGQFKVKTDNNNKTADDASSVAGSVRSEQ